MRPSRRWSPRRLRLSVRGLMLFACMVGGGVGWIGHRGYVRRHAAEAVVRRGGQVLYDHPDAWSRNPRRRFPGSALFRSFYDGRSESVSGIWFPRDMRVDRRARLEALTNLTRLRVLHAPGVELTDGELIAISDLGRLSDLDLEGTGIDDSGLARLAGLVQLRSLNLAGADVTDAGLVHLGRLKRLAVLDLSGTHVTDAGLIILARLPCLRSLTLHSTDVSFEGLRSLGRFPSLRSLEIHSGNLGEEEVARLRMAFPSLEINASPLF
ncbi:hypothetical protein [Singulisphaera sp. PoT]|uniref:hypothetical protein n=1 Tax=Singulisphaera sp. PoT TaxID=3411797 RepID=UPI003BF5A072